MSGIKTDQYSKKGLPNDRGHANASLAENKALRRVRGKKGENQ
jgi:hypothetical protein